MRCYNFSSPDFHQSFWFFLLFEVFILCKHVSTDYHPIIMMIMTVMMAPLLINWLMVFESNRRYRSASLMIIILVFNFMENCENRIGKKRKGSILILIRVSWWSSNRSSVSSELELLYIHTLISDSQSSLCVLGIRGKRGWLRWWWWEASFIFCYFCLLFFIPFCLMVLMTQTKRTRIGKFAISKQTWKEGGKCFVADISSFFLILVSKIREESQRR